MNDETPAERVELLTEETCRRCLARIVEIVDAHQDADGWRSGASPRQAADLIADVLRDWSLID